MINGKHTQEFTNSKSVRRIEHFCPDIRTADWNQMTCLALFGIDMASKER